MSKTIFISAGEASGDAHGAELVKALRQQDSSLRFIGMGSQSMKAAGVDLQLDSTSIAVMGIVEILSHWSELQAALKLMQQTIINQKPDLLILIDYPEFNLKLAKTAKENGVKVLYYISPQVWAWRSWRVKKMRPLIDHMAVIFPFEETFYQQAGIPVTFVGHPLAHTVDASPLPKEIYTQFNLDSEQAIIGLLPGSRKSEIKRILPIILKSAALIKQYNPEVQFALPIAPTLDKNLIENQTQHYADLNIQLIDGNARKVMRLSHSVIIASGTATLETALMETPMAIVYKISWPSYWIMKSLITVKHIGLVNIVAGKRIVPEFIQQLANPDKIAKEINRQLNDMDYYHAIKSELAHTRAKLGEGDCAKNVATLAFGLLSAV